MIDLDLVRSLAASGEGWDDLGRRFGMDADALRARVDPVFAERRRLRQNEWRKRRREQDRNQFGIVLSATKFGGDDIAALSPSDVRARLAERPPDTRSLTGRLLGDPLPGESALDRERQEMRA